MLPWVIIKYYVCCPEMCMIYQIQGQIFNRNFKCIHQALQVYTWRSWQRVNYKSLDYLMTKMGAVRGFWWLSQIWLEALNLSSGIYIGTPHDQKIIIVTKAVFFGHITLYVFEHFGVFYFIFGFLGEKREPTLTTMALTAVAQLQRESVNDMIMLQATTPGSHRHTLAEIIQKKLIRYDHFCCAISITYYVSHLYIYFFCVSDFFPLSFSASKKSDFWHFLSMEWGCQERRITIVVNKNKKVLAKS